jgi:hypothetical protein
MLKLVPGISEDSFTRAQEWKVVLTTTDTTGISRDTFLCAIENGIGQCCKVSTLCHFSLYGWFNVPENITKLIDFLTDKAHVSDWGFKEMLIFSAPESEPATTALLEHPRLKKVYEFPRYKDPADCAGSAIRNSIIVYSLRIS